MLFAPVCILFPSRLRSAHWETLLRIFNHVRKLDIKWKREYLHPIFQEVYQKIFQ